MGSSRQGLNIHSASVVRGGGGRALSYDVKEVKEGVGPSQLIVVSGKASRKDAEIGELSAFSMVKQGR